MGQWGWRIMVLLGLAVVPVGLVIRRHLPETGGRPEGWRSRSFHLRRR